MPQCTASDAEFQLLGRAACPAGSQVGTGTLSVMEGLPGDPHDFDSTFFNGVGEIIELVSVPGTNVTAGLDRLKISGSTLTANPPFLPGGPPDGRTAVREITAQFEAQPSGAQRPYLVSPSTCPDAGVWITHGSFEFADGGKTSVESTTPCAQAAGVEGEAGRPAMKVHVKPRKVRAGQMTRFHARVTSSSARCASGATLRLGKAQSRTNAKGRALLRARLRRSGRVLLRARNSGCQSATAAVRVLPAHAAEPRFVG